MVDGSIVGDKSMLVRNMYFVSPEYKDKFQNIRNYMGDEGERCEGIKKDDKKDTFPKWLRENTFIRNINARNAGEDIFGLANLIGENGAYCEISHEKFYENPEHHFPLGKYGPYRRVVEVKIIPSSKELPIELAETLETNGYQETQIEDKIVQIFLKSYH